MGTDLTQVQKTLTTAQFLAGLGVSAQESQAQLYNYLSFSGRDGKFEINKKSDSNEDADVMEFGKRLVVNLVESKKGFVCWKEQTVVDSVEGPLSGWELPKENELPDHGPYSDKRDGWAKQFMITFKDLDSGKQYQFKTSSASGVRQVGAMLQSIFEQGTMHDLSKQTPVIELSGSTFKSNGYKNWKPVFNLVDWADNPEPLALTVGEPTALAAPEMEAEEDTTAEAIVATRKKK